MEELRQAAHIACADSFIAQTENGYETRFSVKGALTFPEGKNSGSLWLEPW